MKKGYLAILAFAVLGALRRRLRQQQRLQQRNVQRLQRRDIRRRLRGRRRILDRGERRKLLDRRRRRNGLVSTGKAGDLGTIIVDSEGMTLYDFHKDKGTTSSCYGACETAWPPLSTSGEAQAKDGAQSSMLGTTERKDGTMQVTYNGHPLYTFTEDKKPGEANGNDFSAFGAQWYALMPNGEEAPD